jgi:hypothetical protein
MYVTSETQPGTAGHLPEGLPVNEMLRCDLYEVPDEFWDESAFRISAAYLCCPYCGRLGETMDEIPHEGECPFANDDRPS